MSDDATAVWERVAPAWRRHEDIIDTVSRPVTDWMIDRLGLRDGHVLLELGAGTGGAGLRAASSVELGRLILTDLSPTMVERARQRASEAGITSAECAVMSADSVDLDNGSVDAVLCRFVYMLLPDPAAALREARRVLRKNGRIALSVWGPLERNPWITLLGMAVMQHGEMPGPDPFGPGGLFSLSDASTLAKLVHEAGFEDVDVEEIGVSYRAADFDAYWTVQSEIAGPIAALLEDSPPETVASIRAAVEEATRPYSTEAGLDLPGIALAASARA